MTRPLTDDEMDAVGAVPEAGPAAPPTQPLPSGPLSDDEMDASGAVPEAEGRALHMLGNGLTFGLLPRAKAAIQTGAVSGPAYEAARNAEWQKDDAYRAQNPWTATGLEIAGSVPTMFLPGLGAARIAQASAQGANVANNLSRAERLARAAGVGGHIGTTGAEAGALGAKTAALYGALASRENDATGRLTEGATNIPVGYIGGRIGDAIGSRIANVGEQAFDSVRVGGNARVGALTGLRRGLDRDGVTTADIRAAVLPNMGRATAPQPAIEAGLISYGDEIARGATEPAARRAATDAYIQAARQAGAPGTDATLRRHARTAINRYMETQTEVPLALDEAARLAGSRGQNLQWTRRAAAASPGEGRESLFSSVTARQEDLIPTARARITNTAGDTDFLAAKENLRAAHRNVEDQLYSISRNNEQPFDLSRVFHEYNNTMAFRGGQVQPEVYKALQVMRGTPQADGTFQRHTIDTYIQSRGALSDMIDDSYRVNPATGQRTPTALTRQLIDMKARADDVVSASNPQWRAANDITRDLRSVENAMDDGMRVRLSGNDNTSAAVIRRVSTLRDRANRLSRITNPGAEERAERALIENQLEAYRTGFARTLHKELDGLGDTHDLSKKFLKGGRRAQSGVRRTMEVMMGPDDAAQFMGMVERAQVAGTTYKNQFGSQTTPLREALDEAKGDSKIAAMMRSLRYLTSPMQLVQDVGEGLSNRLFEARNAELATRLTAMTDQPQDFIRLLQELDNFAVNRGRVFTAPGVNAYSAPGVAAGAFTANAQERERAARGPPLSGSQQGLTADRLDEELGAFGR